MKRYDLVVIGGGTAGLTAAVTAAGVGARVALIERDRTGGDCLWTGCVPSKALIAAARVAHDMRTADRFGLKPVTPDVDLASVMDHVHGSIATIEPHDSPERMRSLGIEVIHGEARFVGPRRISVAGRLIDTRVAIIATGARPALPPIDGLADAPHVTSDSLWELRELPRRLVVLGGGAIGVELSHAFARLGSSVTTVEMADTILPTEEPEAQALIAERLRSDGVDVREGHTATRVTASGAGTGGTLEVRTADGATASLPYDVLLVATGRTPNTERLGLEAAGVRTTRKGHVVVDETMRTTATGVLAAGDVTERMPFTHVASAEGSTAMMNGLLGLRRTVAYDRLPYAIFTDPELGRVGLTEAQARGRHGDGVVVHTSDYADNDRAITARTSHGFAKLVADRKGRILGATIVGEAAGESIAEIVAWMENDGTLDGLGATTHAYPTFSEGPRGAALEHLRGKYQNPRVRMLLRPVLWLLRRLDRRS